MAKKILAIVIMAANLMIFMAPSAAEAATCSAKNLRWSSSNNRVYITGNGLCALSDIKMFGSKYIPLEEVDSQNKIWHLGANIFVEDGSSLSIHGDSAGGDVNELRLKSDGSGHISIRSKGGAIDISGTKIISWDKSKNGPDADSSDGRAFISAQSSVKDGKKIEARMDIKNSDIGYLGYYGSEAYGLSWKVYGTGTDIFDEIGVYGNVENSRIHDNFFGIYTFGAEAMRFAGNQVYKNEWYGIDPHDDSDNLVITQNKVYENGRHGIICSKRCDNVQITNNDSSNNGGSGIMIHRYVTDSVVSGNIANNNNDSGIAIFDSHSNLIFGNIARNNTKGIRLSVGSSDNIIKSNNFSYNSAYGIFTYKGTDLPISGDGRVKSNTFINNTVARNGYYGLKIKEADNNHFEGNNIIANNVGICLIDSRNNYFVNNLLQRNTQDYCE